MSYLKNDHPLNVDPAVLAKVAPGLVQCRHTLCQLSSELSWLTPVIFRNMVELGRTDVPCAPIGNIAAIRKFRLADDSQCDLRPTKRGNVSLLACLHCGLTWDKALSETPPDCPIEKKSGPKAGK